MHLRDRRLQGIKFRRQRPVGRYVADFCCLEVKLILELDGGQHALQVEADQARTRYLEREGFRVLRFWDNDVASNIDGVLERIAEAVARPHPDPLPGRERGKGGA